MSKQLRDAKTLAAIADVMRRAAETSLREAHAELASQEAEVEAAKAHLDEALGQWDLYLVERALDQHLIAGLAAKLSDCEGSHDRARNRLSHVIRTADASASAYALQEARVAGIESVVARARRKRERKLEDARLRTLTDAVARKWPHAG